MPSSGPLWLLQRRSAREMRRWRCRNTRLKSLPSASRPRAFEHSVWRKKLKVKNHEEEESGNDPTGLVRRNLVYQAEASPPSAGSTRVDPRRSSAGLQASRISNASTDG